MRRYLGTFDRAYPSGHRTQLRLDHGSTQTYEWKNHLVPDRTLLFSASRSSCSYRTPLVIRMMDCDYRDVGVDSKKNGRQCGGKQIKKDAPLFARNPSTMAVPTQNWRKSGRSAVFNREQAEIVLRSDGG